MATTPVYQDNIEEVSAWWLTHAPTGNHEILFENNQFYAAILHEREGLYIFNDEKAMEAVQKWLNSVLEAGLPLDDAHIVKALDAAGYDYIGFLQSLTASMAPPVKDVEGDRRKHPGGWADVSRNLANSFIHIIDKHARIEHGYG